ncbi:hypothetical protein SH139x_003063 [Planctomycetaceae bacterium SH139]
MSHAVLLPIYRSLPRAGVANAELLDRLANVSLGPAQYKAIELLGCGRKANGGRSVFPQLVERGSRFLKSLVSSIKHHGFSSQRRIMEIETALMGLPAVQTKRGGRPENRRGNEGVVRQKVNHAKWPLCRPWPIWPTSHRAWPALCCGLLSNDGSTTAR